MTLSESPILDAFAIVEAHNSQQPTNTLVKTQQGDENDTTVEHEGPEINSI